MELVSAHRDGLSELDSVDVSRGSKEGEHQQKATHGEDIKDEQSGEAQLVQEEEREKGRVEFAVYLNYLTTAYRGLLVPFILLAQILFQGLQIASNYWMACATPPAKDAEVAMDAEVAIELDCSDRRVYGFGLGELSLCPPQGPSGRHGRVEERDFPLQQDARLHFPGSHDLLRLHSQRPDP